MGLSSKQVASDRHGWNQALLQASTLELPKPSSMKRSSSQVQQQQQQQAQHQQQGVEPLKCPRCESTNTKFCYYNNYNKSQPRHFCKACKRHWTKGGTLRNVPVGGGRKNKRAKTSNSGVKAAASKTNNSITITSTTTTTTTNNDNMKMLIQSQPQPQQPRFSLPHVGLSTSLGGDFDDKTFTEEFYKTLVRQPATLSTTTTSPLPDSSITFNHKGLLNDDGIFMGATSSQQQQSLQFPYSNMGGSFESNNNNNNPCSISSSPNFYTLTGDHQPNNGLEETVLNSLNNNTSLSNSSMSDHHQQWNATTTPPATITSNMMDITSNWGWDDFDKFVTVDADLTMPWDDDHTEIKPSGP